MKAVKRQQPTVTVRHKKASEFEIPAYLRTSWTSNESGKFGEILNILTQAGFADETSVESDFHLGLRTVISKIASPSSCMQIMCVIACIDNGQDSGVMSRLASACFKNGVPLILGRGPRQLGAVFGKKRVTCVALTKQAASRAGLFDLIMNMSAVSSSVSIPPEDTDEIKEKWLAVTERFKEGSSNGPKRKAPESGQNINKKPKPEAKNIQPKKATPKKASFFSSFD